MTPKTAPGKLVGQLHASSVGFVQTDVPPEIASGAPPALQETVRTFGASFSQESVFVAAGQGAVTFTPGKSHLTFDVSGSPAKPRTILLDTQGYWAGLVLPQEEAKPSPGAPADRIQQFTGYLKQYGAQQAKPGWLGIGLQPLLPALKRAWNISTDGVVVTRAYPGSPAEQSGLELGDVIVEFNGQKMCPDAETQTSDLADWVRSLPPGTQAPLRLIRDGEEKTLTATTVAAPKSFLTANRFPMPQWGLEVAELTADVRDALLLPDDQQGVIVSNLEKGKEAAFAGLRELDLIPEVNGKQTFTLSAFEEATKLPRPKHRFLVYRDGLTRFMLLPK